MNTPSKIDFTKTTDRVLNSEGKLLKMGYTTGACATAAAKAALLVMLSPEEKTRLLLEGVEIFNTEGTSLTLPVSDITLHEKDYCSCSVIKDSGDDYDVTNGLEIVADVKLTTAFNAIQIEGGHGVGRVTKAGLRCPLGSAAINPTPLQMLKENLSSIKPIALGIEVLIRVPKGVEISRKTFNERLGVQGGISIIGTTGIVRPMSEDAFMASIYAELKQKYTLCPEQLVLVPGKHGENFCFNVLQNSRMNFNQDQIVQMSNFVGFSIQSAASLGFKKILIVGHVGKLIKIAGGIFNTHSKVADAKSEIICTQLALDGAPLELIRACFDANTTDEISDLLFETPYFKSFQTLTQRAKTKCEVYIHGEAQIQIIMYDMKNRVLGDTND
ncbi:cobalt-precorrin-5B (C(1))-methyltransferase CbiD [Fusibacter ferrireducens]|uniref:Cobalt-precorrin-5B C(1)-methyltransferase n=1 Tax=Fusibacter ferrireducens TaxID=2785058 RepID=A0ABR9ZS21_9FIRM|nr:cobalt-precorrin-5B (C(1))-methyltransferase CbiD [Fusibacter ferrireducens]MBF4693257.1 cobalamin biosynthesis protein CbiD [Fusibacter ferrireducens]